MSRKVDDKVVWMVAKGGNFSNKPFILEWFRGV